MKICSRCNTELPDTAKFCTRCGLRMEVAVPVQPAPAPVVEAPAPAVEAPAPVVEAPAPAVEAPAPVPVAPAPAVEAPAPVPVAPAPAVETPAPVPVTPAMSKKAAKKMAKEAKMSKPKVAPTVGPVSKNQKPKTAKAEEKPSSKTSALGVIGMVLFSLLLVVSVVFSYISSAAMGICSSDTENLAISVDGVEYSVEDFTDMARLLSDTSTDTGRLVEAIIEHDDTCQVKVDTKIYDVNFDGETIEMFRDVVLSEQGITSAADTVTGIGFVVFAVLLVFSLFTAAASVVAIRSCLGKKKAGSIVPAVILIVVGLITVAVSVLGMVAPDLIPLLAVFAAQPVAVFSLIPAALAILSGILLFVVGLLSGKKKEKEKLA